MFSFYGVNRIRDCIAEDNRLAGYMGERIAEDDELELLAPPSLSICCFRYVPPEWKRELLENGDGAEIERRLNGLNEEIMLAIQRSGKAYLSNASLNGHYALRACAVNFRTTESDIDITLELVRDWGRRLSSKSHKG
jgi:glutamate/tyrosine decarboxylase-like PLP-dependent enzyme